MAWDTPKLDYANNYIPTPTDFNRIEGNTDYIYNTGIKPDTDALWLVGRCRIFSPFPDHLGLAHPDNANVTNYHSVQNASGHSVFNGSLVKISIEDVPQIDFDGSTIDMEKPVNPTNTPTSGTWTTSQTIPRGIYNVILNQSLGNTVFIRHGTETIMFRDGQAAANDQQNGGTIFSDGTNVNVVISGAGASVKYYKY